MIMRVYAIYHQSLRILIFFLTLCFASLLVDGVCILWAVACLLTNEVAYAYVHEVGTVFRSFHFDRCGAPIRSCQLPFWFIFNI